MPRPTFDQVHGEEVYLAEVPEHGILVTVKETPAGEWNTLIRYTPKGVQGALYFDMTFKGKKDAMCNFAPRLFALKANLKGFFDYLDEE